MSAPRVAIDAHALGRGQAGYESYLTYLTAELPTAAPDMHFLLYRDLAPSRARRLFWELPARLLRDRPDVLHVQYAAPFPCFTPLVATIHDLSFIDVPQFMGLLERNLLRAAVARTARIARRIVTVSEFSKRRLLSHYGLPDDRVIVAPNAAGPQFTPGPAPAFEPYILMTGDLQPRKNHLGAIRAFAALLERNPSWKHRFKIAGRETEFATEIRREAASSGAGDRIDFLGYVPDEVLPAFYRGAAVCVYPSFYEGFGLPVLESMASGTPVVTSNSTALAEVAGKAALLANPADAREISQAIETAIGNRAAMAEAGLRRARDFSWKESALRTSQAFREAFVSVPARRLMTVHKAT
jgi:glycosyltransferase involved in cell wall biosynthesis